MNKKGFTLIEVIVSICLVSVIMATFLALLVKVKNKYNTIYDEMDVDIYSSSIVRVINSDIEENGGIRSSNCNSIGTECEIKLVNNQLRKLIITTPETGTMNTSKNIYCEAEPECDGAGQCTCSKRKITKTLKYIDITDDENSKLLYIKTLSLIKNESSKNSITSNGYVFGSMSTISVTSSSKENENYINRITTINIPVYDLIDSNDTSHDIIISSASKYNKNSNLVGIYQGEIIKINLSFNNVSVENINDVSSSIVEKYREGFYTVSCDENNDEIYNKIESNIVIPLASNAGYKFEGYYYTNDDYEEDVQIIDSEGKINVSNTFFENDVTLIAKWTNENWDNDTNGDIRRSINNINLKSNLSKYSWSEINYIAELVASKRISRETLNLYYGIDIGDTKKATINNETHEFRLVGINHDVDSDDNVLGMTFEQVDLMNTKYKMYKKMSDEDSWENSYLKYTINNFSIQDDLNNIIIPAKKVSLSSVTNAVRVDSISKLWIMSETEVSNNTYRTRNKVTEGFPYEYYTNKEYDFYYIRKSLNGSLASYWLRSAYAYGKNDEKSLFAYVSYDTLETTLGGTSNKEYGIAICFSIGQPVYAEHEKYITDLTDYTWTEIRFKSSQVASGEISKEELSSIYKIDIGDIKSATINNETHNFRLVGINHDVDKNGNTIGMTFEQVDLMNKTYQMNTTMSSDDSWIDSNLKETIDKFSIGSPSDDLADLITPAKKPCVNSVNKVGITYVTSALWIMSETEISGNTTKTYKNNVEGKQYEYYSNEGLEKYKIEKKIGYTLTSYWLRSATLWNSSESLSRFAYVSKESDKTILGGASTKYYGIAICFSM